MPICKKCNERFPNRVKIDGKSFSIHKRSYCLKCSPFGNKSFCGPTPKNRKKWDPKTLEKVCISCNRSFIHKTKNLECTTCRAAKTRKINKLKALAMLGGKCQKCGYSKSSYALDFHHKNPTEKLFTLSSNWQRPWSILSTEVAKCELLCRNCHAEVHEALNACSTAGRCQLQLNNQNHELHL